ncbi:U-box domain-containing protein 21-like [Aristolochia californica]|uniref:U-box domain-containing protein 21-like n=1 Tax=Aristolochia californica TaxID=171875 RepID=UPI0035E17D46
MTSTLRILKAGRRNLAGQGRTISPAAELTTPTHFRCPISLDLMKDPVTLCTGITYDRQSIETWLDSGNNTCPVTNQVLKSFEQIPNHNIRRMIQDWCVENRSFGIERIPTPRIPISSAAVSEISLEISGATRRKDDSCVRESVKKMSRLCRESERDRCCIVANGAAAVLSAAFDSFAANSFENHTTGLEEILQAITWMFPLDSEARSYLASASSLRALQWFLKCGDLTVRRNAALLIKELVSAYKRHVDTLSDAEGFVEAFTKIIREPICPQTTKASLATVYHLVTSSQNQKISSRFVEMGLVSLLLEMLVNSEKSICEKALGVLDGICNSEEGRQAAYGHALTLPLLVKKMFRVSDLATGFIVSILWKLGKNYEGDEGVLMEALQAGAFQKVLLLLQVGCSEKTKEKATELLKMLNIHRERGECIDSMDFKQLKRSF